jgi:hypothetical protein
LAANLHENFPRHTQPTDVAQVSGGQGPIETEKREIDKERKTEIERERKRQIEKREIEKREIEKQREREKERKIER